MILCGVNMVVVYSDGSWKFVPARESILWYDWNGEYHILSIDDAE